MLRPRNITIKLFVLLSVALLRWTALAFNQPKNCDAQTCPEPAAYGRQPYPTEMPDVFQKAGTNQLGNNGPTLPQIWKGYPPAQAKLVSPYAPCILLEAIGETESPGWYQFIASYNQSGNTLISADCGYGIMQITSGMGGGAGFVPSRVAAEPAYNIGTGARILIQWWNSLNTYIGTNDPAVAEDWYYAVWDYNGSGYTNNPNNPNFYASRPPFDGSQPRTWYPYQELVWGYAANPPSNQGVPFWTASQLTLPSKALITNPPPTHIDRPTPAHGSCSVSYLPSVLKDYPACAKPIQNSDFESGSASWTLGGAAAVSPQKPYSGLYSAWLGGYNNANDSLYQTIYIPVTGPTGKSVVSASLAYYWYMETEETTHPYDSLYVKIRNSSGFDLTTLETLSDGSTANTWNLSSFDLTPYIGQTIQVYFRGTTDVTNKTSFFVDDVYLYACEGP